MSKNSLSFYQSNANISKKQEDTLGNILKQTVLSINKYEGKSNKQKVSLQWNSLLLEAAKTVFVEDMQNQLLKPLHKNTKKLIFLPRVFKQKLKDLTFTE